MVTGFIKHKFDSRWNILRLEWAVVLYIYVLKFTVYLNRTEKEMHAAFQNGTKNSAHAADWLKCLYTGPAFRIIPAVMWSVRAEFCGWSWGHSIESQPQMPHHATKLVFLDLIMCVEELVVNINLKQRPAWVLNRCDLWNTYLNVLFSRVAYKSTCACGGSYCAHSFSFPCLLSLYFCAPFSLTKDGPLLLSAVASSNMCDPSKAKYNTAQGYGSSGNHFIDELCFHVRLSEINERDGSLLNQNFIRNAV